MTWIQTVNGRRFDLLTPDPAAIDPDELALVLARMPRFGGHFRPGVAWYSVAQHSVLVSRLVALDRCEAEGTPCQDRADYICPACKRNEVPRLAALLHDAAEAYWGFGDICRPAKHLTYELHRALQQHEYRVEVAVAARFGLHPSDFCLAQVKHADNVALATEARDLMARPPAPWEELPTPSPEIIVPLGVDAARELFRRRLDQLWVGTESPAFVDPTSFLFSLEEMQYLEGESANNQTGPED